MGRTAVAVGGLADSGMVLRLTRSRLWIGLLATLLVGIVGLNVFALSFNAASSKTAGLADELASENSAVRNQLAEGLSNERLQRAAVRLGLGMPEPGAVLYLKPRAGDAAAAAQRLRRGQIGLGTAYVPAAPVAAETTTEALADVQPAAPVATQPAADPTATTAADSATTAATQTAPTDTQVGGVAMP